MTDSEAKLGKRRRRRRCGPRSAAVKAIASRNALRHGFAAQLHRHAPSSDDIKRFIEAIVAGDDDPAVGRHALRIAESEFMLNEIMAHKVLVIERLREKYAVPFAAKDNSLQLATARAMAGWLACREIELRLPAVIEKYQPLIIYKHHMARRAQLADWLRTAESVRKLYPEDKARAASIERCLDNMHILMPPELTKEFDDIVPVWLKLLTDEDSWDRALPSDSMSDSSEKRNEYEALEAAVLDLIQLDRYEHRAWSRQKRAILELANIKLQCRLRQDAEPGSGVSNAI